MEATMGLLDILNGMQNGPRGQRAPDSGGGSGGMSPITMAILGLLAYKAFKSFGGSRAEAPAGGPAPRLPVDDGSAAGGGLGDMLKGGLGGLLAGGAAGSVLSGGLGDLVRQFQQSGHGETANSWVGTGQNKAISPDDLASALGADQIDHLMAQSGLSRSELLDGLSQQLPDVVNQLTPQGRLPTDEEAGQMV
jgi:uncharacterized protein YidB (DUF937 family)